MANIQKTEGIILTTRPFKESSLFCSVFTKKFGKIKVLAKGARRPKSKFCGTLEPFSLDEIIFYKRELKEIYTLSDAVIINNFEKIRSSVIKVNAAQILCEFFEKTLAPGEKEEKDYNLLLFFLKKLPAIDESKVKSLTYYFLLKALGTGGVKPYLKDCVRCRQPIKLTEKVNFSISEGGLVCDKHFDDTVIFLVGKTVRVIREVYENKTPVIEEDTRNEIEKLIPDYLFYHLHNLVLNSLKFLKY